MANGIRHPHSIGSRLLLDGNGHSRHTIDPHDGSSILGYRADLGDIPSRMETPSRLATKMASSSSTARSSPKVRRENCGLADDDPARGDVEILGPDGLDDLIDGKAVGLQASRIQLHPDFPAAAPLDRHCGHAVNPLKVVGDLLCRQAAKLCKGPVRR